ncbi:hypothetical protein N0V91_010291 [Didymella pomorum]|uniref:Uncharacterized protein n=1 Tax=Didymella pomorum TaxID=749634 RepID=A0A9W8Z3X6_9PLEO|nr:hypothetical protein N0V91_010291 [Didymella pomorum]
MQIKLRPLHPPHAQGDQQHAAISSSADWRTTTDVHALNKLIKAQKAKFTRAMSKDTKKSDEFDILGLNADVDPELYRLDDELAALRKSEIEAHAIYTELMEMIQKRNQILAELLDERMGDEDDGDY